MKRTHLLAVVTLFAAATSGCGPATEEASPEPTVAVQVARVRQADLDVVVRAPGTVYPREEADVTSRLTARIVELEARKGDTVSAGQSLAHLEDQDLLAQQREAAAAVVDAEATLARVSAGTLPADLERARGQVAATQAALDEAQANYDRRSGLFDEGAIPERDLLASRTELATARANAEVATAELGLLESQTGTRDVEIAQSRLDQAHGRMDLIDSQVDFATIRSPFSGTVTEQFLFPGDMANPDRPLFTVSDLSVIVVRANVPEAGIADVQVGQACSLTPADQPGASYAGRITVVNSAVDPATRTVEVWCEIANPAGNLRGGVFGTLAITTATLSGAHVVPVAAVQFDEGQSTGTVMVVGPDDTAKVREVETGRVAGNQVEIASGLAADEIVIVEGGYGLPDGTRVSWTGDPE